MRQFKVTVKGDSKGVEVRVKRVAAGKSEFVEIDLNCEEFDELAAVIVRERLRRADKKK